MGQCSAEVSLPPADYITSYSVMNHSNLVCLLPAFRSVIASIVLNIKCFALPISVAKTHVKAILDVENNSGKISNINEFLKAAMRTFKLGMGEFVE